MKYTMRYLTETFRHSPGLALGVLLTQGALALLPSLQLYAEGAFLDDALGALSGSFAWRAVLSSLTWMLFLLIMAFLLQALQSLFTLRLRLAVDTAVERRMLQKRSSLAYWVTEHKEHCDLISRVTEEEPDRISAGYSNLLSVLEVLVRLLALAVAICWKSFWMGLLVLIALLAMIPLSMKCGESDYEAFSQANRHFRRARYFRSLLSSREHVEERTVFAYSEEVGRRWKREFEAGQTQSERAIRKNLVRTEGASLGLTLLSFLIFAVLLVPLRQGGITTGFYISIVTAVLSAVKLMGFSFTSLVEKLVDNQQYMRDYSAFYQLPEEADCQAPVQPGVVEQIVFDDVCFVYPGTTAPVLRHFSHTFRQGNHYALVGENGCGKTTLVKLLLGLYRTYEGSIRINGWELRDIPAPELYRFFSVVHQDFARYELTLRENLQVGQAGLSDEKIWAVLEDLQLTELTDALPQGLSTHIGRLEPGGIDLSGGQWQRVAIARALLRQGSFCILDEPTAALDPLQEREIYRLFSRLQQDTGSLLITHRLGGVQDADEILVLAGGAVCECGSHAQLMALGGIYARMYELQRGWYHAEASVC